MKARVRRSCLLLIVLRLLAPSLAGAGNGEPVERQPPPPRTPLTFESAPELTLADATRDHLLAGHGDSSVDLSPVEIHWRRTTVSTPDGRTVPATLRLELTPGPSMT
ncbi:MAG: hypothetical protein KDD47_27805, partial [Acidobacteria bacterium]|nr:hypothetical protein [Acidobacteriota bacterium]